MTRLANQNLAEVDPEPWVEFLLYSHPALSKRIAMAEGFEKGLRKTCKSARQVFRWEKSNFVSIASRSKQRLQTLGKSTRVFR